MDCPCIIGSQFKHRRSDYFEVMRDFQRVEREIVRYNIDIICIRLVLTRNFFFRLSNKLNTKN